MKEKTEVLMDYSMLRGRIYEKFGSIQAFANALGVPRQRIDLKLKNVNGFSQKDIAIFCDALDIDPARIGVYFFTTKVCKCRPEQT